MATRTEEKTAGRRAGRRKGGGADGSPGAGLVVGASHPSRAGSLPPDTHLRPFTQTAETPAVGGAGRAGPDPRFATTGMVAAYPGRTRRRAPIWFLVTLWTMLILIAASAALLGVHHFRPAALRSIESAAAAGPTATGAGAGSGSNHSSSTAAPRSGNRNSVSVVTNGATAAVTVPVSQYDVVIATTGLCWVSVTDPGSGTPVFAQTLPAGTQKSFPASSGGLVVNIGSSHVTLSVQVKGKTIAGSELTPTAAPFTLTYSSSS